MLREYDSSTVPVLSGTPRTVQIQDLPGSDRGFALGVVEVLPQSFLFSTTLRSESRRYVSAHGPMDLLAAVAAASRHHRELVQPTSRPNPETSSRVLPVPSHQSPVPAPHSPAVSHSHDSRAARSVSAPNAAKDKSDNIGDSAKCLIELRRMRQRISPGSISSLNGSLAPGTWPPPSRSP